MDVELLWITENAQETIEEAGRTAYASKARAYDGSAVDFIRMLIRRGHHSVLEHASASFRIKGISRACSHQLVRHRLCSFTQRSQRYVDERSFEFVVPPLFVALPGANRLFRDAMLRARDVYARLQQMGIPNEDARFVLPNATCTEIVVTANLRQWRHVIQLRTNKHAQWEIREVAIRILDILLGVAPAVFEDIGALR